jgi:hypothetical protein
VTADGTESTTALQIRLLLEQRCGAVAQRLAAADGDVRFALFMFAASREEPVGSTPFAFAGHLPTIDAARACIGRWVEDGQVPILGTVTVSADAGAAIKNVMGGLADWIGRQCLPGTCFALFLYDETSTLGYVSSAERADVQKILAEWLERIDHGAHGDAGS